MAQYDFAAARLHVRAPLEAGARLPLERAQSGYLLTVLRLGAGGTILVFNGRDGEWRARVEPTSRRDATLEIVEQTRAQTPTPDLHLLFAPLKHARLDYLVQKAVEMGAGTIRPVWTQRTVPSRVNLERMEANAVEAAEQCGILAVPSVLPDLDLAMALGQLEPERLLVFCDEEAALADPVAALRAAALRATDSRDTPLAVLIGPEGGFAPEERAMAARHCRVCPISLGPRILRADTAAVAALALVGAALGGWG